MFVISMTTTTALSLANSGGSSIASSNSLLEMDLSGDEESNLAIATPRNWLLQRLGIVVVALSLIGVAGGWAMLAAGAAGYNVYLELNDLPLKIAGGPNLGVHGIKPGIRALSYALVVAFVVVLVGGYLYRLKPRFNPERRVPNANV
jgi:hypothetical protein